MHLILEILILLVGGVAAGILSSLFGLGGGLVVVPLLNFYFNWQEIASGAEMHFAVGTSLCVMLVTTSNVIWGRYKRGHIVLSLWKSMFPWMSLGAIMGAIFALFISTDGLKWIFILFLLGVIVNSFWKKHFSKIYVYEDFEMPSLLLRRGVSWVTGFLSVMLGVGGSVFTLPLFRHAKLPMAYASGTASSLTPAVAICGALVYVLEGWGKSSGVPMSFGYLYFPSFLGLACGTFIGVPIGLYWSHRFSDRLKANLYRGFLILILISLLV